MDRNNEKHIFVSQLTAGQQLEEVFLVARKTLAETKAGKPYLALGLMDKTGEIEARVWDNALQFDPLVEEGAFIRVQAVARPFREQLQLGVSGLQPVAENRINPGDFMPASRRSSTEMARELAAVINGIGDGAIKALLQEIFQGDILERFQRAPAAKRLHHAYLGGLMEHTLSVAAMAEQCVRHYPLLDRDLLLAGALLHDLAKIDEYEYTRPPFNYTDRGRLVGHIVLGVELVRRAAEKVSAVSSDQVDQLVHIILSHHGQLAYGSPVLPMTPEAILLHHLDDMDAKMSTMDELRRKMSGSGCQWTEYQRHLERYLYLRGNEDGENTGPGEEIGAGTGRGSGRSPVREAVPTELPVRQRTLF
ncbi:HD domain-containing protein [Desulfobulbus alkaliphilus]|nr:HD domain-containing protein [Desulfobulbus alkaliphilus]